ncbi:c-type cytochrome [Mitsuaria sp. GD03876]|uniref:c-type cytochrome n=1 Tax=Mitsuaria sp. GD03876 TaxID=2975399 RepID=UPI002446A636|nr:c-type cytochrome [Mitsuaria sp. GD03876]MDH0864149.1 c-type cytochrome [Mitsuaria sp. GD03876]
MKIPRPLPGVLIAAVLGLGLSAASTALAQAGAASANNSAVASTKAPPTSSTASTSQSTSASTSTSTSTSAADGGPRPLRPLTNDTAERIQACTLCHGPQGRATPQGYFPRLAGKPAGYLFNQLQSFRDGRRHHALMAGLLRNMSDDYLHEIAGYFAALDVPYPAPAPSGLTTAQQARAERLVTQGDPSRKVPACTACHGSAMAGREPATPGLIGLPRDYLVGQLGAWRNGLRRAHAPDCMADVAKALSTDDIAAVASWLAARPAGAHPEPVSSAPLPVACGGLAP